MIKSISKKLIEVSFPSFEGEIKMLPFNLSDLSSIPKQFLELVMSMINFLPVKEGIAYLTVDGKMIPAGSSHRRGGAHIDGNYIPEMCGWGSSGTGGNGWKVGENGRALDSDTHKLSYNNPDGGMLIVSDYAGCKGWNGAFNGEPGIGGDCRHIELDKGFILEPNTVYYGSSQFIHESLPLEKEVYRTMIRITLPLDYPIIN